MKTAAMFLVTLFCFSFSNNPRKGDPWMNYVTPGEFHELLKRYTGKWDMEISMWVKPGQPQVVKVHSTNNMELGGRFLQLKQNGTLLGMPYESATTIGYNTASEKVELTSVSNMGTGLLYLSGTWDKNTRKAVLSGQMANPTGGDNIQVRQVITFASGFLLIENFDKNGSAPERKSMQYKFTRKQP